jgi:hypothetical protein
MYLGADVGDREIEGWAYETASWFAIYDGSPANVVAAAEAGLRVSPSRSAPAIMNALKLATAFSRQRDRSRTERAIEQASDAVASLAMPEHPEHHFVFDPPKLDLYVSRSYAWLGMPDEAEQFARSVMAANQEAGTPIPTRTSMARLDLASALLDRGEIEAACQSAAEAFGPLLRRDVIKRAAEFDARLRAAHGSSSIAAIRDFRERYQLARNASQQ